MLSDANLERYARQVIMPHIGEDGQERSLAAKVLVVGAADDPIFGSDKNHIMLISETTVETWPRMLKTELADNLAERIAMEFLT